MDRLKHSKLAIKMRQARVRSKIHGTKEQPRLSVHVSNTHITAQLIDDDSSTTLAYVSTIGRKVSGTMTDKSAAIGKELAKKAKSANIKKVVFDRGEKLYHGRVKALADAAREEGLEF